MFKHILVPIDGSECSLEALRVAAEFARDQQARLTICTVVDPAKAAAMTYGEAQMTAAALDALDDEGQALLATAAAGVRSIWPSEVKLFEGQAVDTIVDAIRELDADMVVMGSHGRSGFPRFFLGSVAEGVIRNAAVPVMVVRQAAQKQPAHVAAAQIKSVRVPA